VAPSPGRACGDARDVRRVVARAAADEAARPTCFAESASSALRSRHARRIDASGLPLDATVLPIFFPLTCLNSLSNGSQALPPPWEQQRPRSLAFEAGEIAPFGDVPGVSEGLERPGCSCSRRACQIGLVSNSVPSSEVVHQGVPGGTAPNGVRYGSPFRGAERAAISSINWEGRVLRSSSTPKKRGNHRSCLYSAVRILRSPDRIPAQNIAELLGIGAIPSRQRVKAQT
jgi:hypothetical protein